MVHVLIHRDYRAVIPALEKSFVHCGQPFLNGQNTCLVAGNPVTTTLTENFDLAHEGLARVTPGQLRIDRHCLQSNIHLVRSISPSPTSISTRTQRTIDNSDAFICVLRFSLMSYCIVYAFDVSKISYVFYDIIKYFMISEDALLFQEVCEVGCGSRGIERIKRNMYQRVRLVCDIKQKVADVIEVPRHGSLCLAICKCPLQNENRLVPGELLHARTLR